MDNKYLIKQSLDVQYFKRRLLLTLFSFSFILLIIFLGYLPFYHNLNSYNPNFYWQLPLISLTTLLILFSPLTIYYLIKLRNIKRFSDNYLFQEVILTKSNSIGSNKFFHFIVEIENKEQGKIRVATKTIFSINQSRYPSYQGFIDKKVIIGYNIKSKEVITIDVYRK